MFYKRKEDTSAVRPILIQSDSVSQNRPFFGRILVGLLFRQSSTFYSFALFLEVVGVREYCCMAVESWLEAL